MKAVVEHMFTGDVSTSYDSQKTYIGSGLFIKQHSGLTSSDNYISPFDISVGRPMESSTPVTGAYPHVHSWNDNIDWVFLADNSAAATSRRVALMEYSKITNQFTYKGSIVTTAITGNQTIRGFRVGIYRYSAGTVNVNGTTVNGNNTNWTDIRFAAGSRIGFGSTDKTEITNWYEISSINSNTGITLSTDSNINQTGLNYVIEEIRVYMTITNATTTNGGLFIIKGLNYSTFSSSPTTISTATTIDNIRATYWLKDAASETMIASWGISIDDVNNDYTEEFVYVPAGTYSAKSYFIYKYNVRALLTNLSGGESTLAYMYKTGAINSAFPGSIQQVNSCRIITTNHGPGSGVKCLYIAATTRINRCILNNITDGSTNYLADSLIDVPPGGINTFPVQNIGSIEYSDIIDRIITTGTVSATLAGRCQIGYYNTNSNPWEEIFLATDMQYNYSSGDQNAPVHPTTNMTVMSLYSQNGFLYIIRNGTTNLLNQIYCLPLAAHKTFADITNEYIITPKIITTNSIKYYRLYVNSNRHVGESAFNCSVEDFDILYRVSGIDNNSGSWNLIEPPYNLENILLSNEIQFKIKFKILGAWCIPSKIYSISLVYEDSNTDSHYTPSVNKSNVISKIFAYRQSLSWNSNIPNLRIRLYNAYSGLNILDDTVLSSGNGIWQYSSDGVNWNIWDNTKDNVGYYIRYTANTLPDGIIVRALLTQ